MPSDCQCHCLIGISRLSSFGVVLTLLTMKGMGNRYTSESTMKGMKKRISIDSCARVLGWNGVSFKPFMLFMVTAVAFRQGFPVTECC